MSAALTNQLRESLILERAKALHHVVMTAPQDEAIDIIRLALRVERDEGIAAGIDQAQKYSEQLRQWSDHPACQEVVAGITQGRQLKAQGKS